MCVCVCARLTLYVACMRKMLVCNAYTQAETYFCYNTQNTNRETMESTYFSKICKWHPQYQHGVQRVQRVQSTGVRVLVSERVRKRY